jgi:hypothetical protein
MTTATPLWPLAAVVAQGAEHDQALVQLQALAQPARGHDLLHRGRPLAEIAQALQGHPGLHALAGAGQLRGPLDVMGLQLPGQAVQQGAQVPALGGKGPPAVDHDGQGQDAGGQEQVEDPDVAEEGDLQEDLDHGGSKRDG